MESERPGHISESASISGFEITHKTDLSKQPKILKSSIEDIM